MNIQYDDWNEKLKYYCAKCNRGMIDAPSITEYLYCPYCGHEYDFEKVNRIRKRIVKAIAEEE